MIPPFPQVDHTPPSPRLGSYFAPPKTTRKTLGLRVLSANRGTQLGNDLATSGRFVFLARIERGFEHLMYVPELLHPRRNDLEPVLDKPLHASARSGAKKLRDVPERKARSLRRSNEAKAMHVFV